ncbi:hypothetical protein [Litoribacillus peritrichatus]|uniref:DoxX family membrane protein n=1 Tax=Litoribacillus peritrichatus TaxID=718191 RepID=A0ABP7M9H6_9GAMM
MKSRNSQITINNKIALIIIGLLTFVPSYAHVRWFVDSSDEVLSFEWTGVYYLLIALAFVFAAVCFAVDRKLSPLYRGAFFNTWPKVDQWRLLAYGCGGTLIWISFENIFLAPNIVITQDLETYLIIQAVCGVALVSSLPPRYSGAFLFVLCFLAMDAVAASLWIDYIFEFIAISIAFCLSHKFPSVALHVLRIGLGIQLMVLAIHNKLMEPALGLEFLTLHPWNFMTMMGLEAFNDLLFVFSAGIAELTFGVLILLGIATRLVIVVVSGFFLMTSILLGLHELVGHVPIIACCLVLFSLGGGESLFSVFTKAVEHIMSPLPVRHAEK